MSIAGIGFIRGGAYVLLFFAGHSFRVNWSGYPV
jgi:hypothetical protein